MTHELSLAEKPTLVGERVVLRPVHRDDALGLLALDAETLRLTGTHETHGLSVLEEWYATRDAHTDRLDLSILERASGTWIGEVVLNDLRAQDASCGIRILLQSQAWCDRGFGTEAMRLVLAHAFETVGLHRVELEVLEFNPRARHVYERLGFTFEGTRRESLRGEDRWFDAHLMALLADNWALHRGHAPT